MGETFFPGTETWYASDSPNSSFSAIFEDDCETGYFYAYDRAVAETPILDAVQIYNVVNVVDRSVKSTVDIIWSSDGMKAGLLLNDYPHAVIDFNARAAYCRTGFPPAPQGWRHGSWDDALMELFRNR